MFLLSVLLVEIHSVFLYHEYFSSFLLLFLPFFASLLEVLHLQLFSLHCFLLYGHFYYCKHFLNFYQFCCLNLCKSGCLLYKARHAHKRLYMVLPKYSRIQVLPGITSCRLVKDNKQAIELNSLLLNNMPKDGYG